MVAVLRSSTNPTFRRPDGAIALIRAADSAASVIALARDPAIADFHVGALGGSPRDPVCGFFLTRVAGMGGEGVIESGGRWRATEAGKSSLVLQGMADLLAGTARSAAALWTPAGAGCALTFPIGVRTRF